MGKNIFVFSYRQKDGEDSIKEFHICFSSKLKEQNRKGRAETQKNLANKKESETSVR